MEQLQASSSGLEVFTVVITELASRFDCIALKYTYREVIDARAEVEALQASTAEALSDSKFKIESLEAKKIQLLNELRCPTDVTEGLESSLCELQ